MKQSENLKIPNLQLDQDSMYNMKGSKLFSRYKKNQDKIKNIFQDNQVVVAYLFGSATENNIGPLSDLDFAIYLDKKLSTEEPPPTPT